MSRGTYYKPGDWLFICDQCGVEKNASEARLQWDGLRVCRGCWDYRHPQELIRPIIDPVAPPWTRPWVPLFVNAPNKYDTRSLATYALGTLTLG